MPTLLGFSGIPVPVSVEGKNLSQIMLGERKDNITGTLISYVQPFGQWTRQKRGIVSKQFTYVRDLKVAWLLFDNIQDPFQLNNLVNQPGFRLLQQELDSQLNKMLREWKYDFRPGMEYVKKWNYVVDETETVPYTRMNYEGKAINE